MSDSPAPATLALASWHSYPSIFNIGHKAVAELLKRDVLVEEKVDGSQFSFGRFDIEGVPTLKARSKGSQLLVEAPEKMFTLAIEQLRSRFELLRPGWTYRGEYLAKPKHNALAYDRVPRGNVILFDVNTGEADYLGPDEKAAEAERLGFECVPLLHRGPVADLMTFRSFLDRVSVLGGQKIEGVVVKPADYALWGADHKCVMAKFVSEAFKEVHGANWKGENPSKADIIDLLGNQYRLPARWNKAIQHLREEGKLEGSPRDIGLIVREVPRDIEKECEAEIKQVLYDYAAPKIWRHAVRGLAEHYKEQLLRQQFEGADLETAKELAK